MGPKIIQHDNLDKAPNGSGPHESAPWARAPRALLDWRGLLVVLGIAAVFVLILYFRNERAILDWLAYGWGKTFVIVLCLFLILFLAKRWLLQEQPGGYKMLWLRVDRSGVRSSFDEQRVMESLERVMEKYAARQYPHVAQITLTNPQPPKDERPLIEAETITTVPMLPPAEWLPWFDTRPHGLLAAETGGGKSTTVKAVLKSRIDRGELVFLIDPHSSDWFGLPSIGGGEDWAAVWIGMQVVIEEYTRRMQTRDAYLHETGHELPHTHFPRLNVLLDEANTACRKLSIAKRGEETRWEQFAEALGSGARKVGLSILLLAQSANVEDIGLSGPMRQNFTRLALDAATTRLMINREETDAQRKKELHEALVGVDYPATAVQRGQVILLDRRGLDQVGTPANARAALWQAGYDRVEALMAQRQIAAQQPAPRVVSAYQQAKVERASVSAGAIVYPATVTSTNGKIAWLLRHGYTYRQIEKELSVSHQTISRVSVALQASKTARQTSQDGSGQA